MKYKIITASILASALSVFAVGGALAQHEEHHPQNQTTQDQSQAGTMGGGMMGMMGQMTAHHKKMSDLMTKLMASMKAIEDEKDPAALKSKLAEHRTLLEQMHAQMMQQGGMMKDMPGMMMKNCPMMGGSNKPSTQ
jgi:hypothetical protein